MNIDLDIANWPIGFDICIALAFVFLTIAKFYIYQWMIEVYLEAGEK